MKRNSIIVFACALAVLSLCSQAYASPSNWTEVTRFTGSATQDTDYFVVIHSEWRINWTYTPNPAYPTMADFGITAKDNTSSLVTSIFETGNTTTTGITYVHNWQGTFYLSISVANLQSYTIIIQQDLDSIPEYTNLTLLASLGLAGLALIISKRTRTQT